ncbi:MAG: heme NO-binding domain-containing protein [Pseudomonadota bacterium]
MHGLINYGLQSFAEEIYGKALWQDLVAQAELPCETFETMLIYDDDVTLRIVDHLAEMTRHKRTEILEDFGTFLVSEHSSPAILSLLKLAGASYRDFLMSLEDVAARLKIALPELDIPNMQVTKHASTQFELSFQSPLDGYGEAFLGLLRAMADYYNVLATLDLERADANNVVSYRFLVTLYEEDWAKAQAGS